MIETASNSTQLSSSKVNLAVLGSTGSIGRSTLEVVAASGGAFRIVGLTAHRNHALLQEQVRQFRPDWAVLTDPAGAGDLAADWPSETRLFVGPEHVNELVRSPGVQTVVAAVVGSAGLMGTWAALEAGKRVALANKETLVMAGPLVMDLARRSGAELLPVDSEHSAIFQVLQAGRRSDVRRIVLTASGGPFRNHTLAQLEDVTVAQALAHPTWVMGKKITVDSATMMNKALEIIEARWLFDLSAERIAVTIHPQSIVHSLDEFVDGSVVAQLSPPDMKLPIQYALSWPQRAPSPAARIDWSTRWKLDFEPADPERFPALELGLSAAAAGGTAGCVLNAANEAAVEAFLGGELRFVDIVRASRAVLEHHEFESRPSLERLLELDRWARAEVAQWICTCSP